MYKNKRSVKRECKLNALFCCVNICRNVRTHFRCEPTEQGIKHCLRNSADVNE